MRKTPLMRLKEIEMGQPIDALLLQGREAGKTWTEIAEWLGIPYTTLIDWRRKRGAREVRTLVFGDGAETETAGVS